MNAHSPKWASADHTAIDLIVTADGEEMPFTASQNDSEAHGRELFARAVAGEFGEIAEYAAPAMTQQEIISILTAAVQEYLDAKAQERNYDGILSACTYATSTNLKFASEGQACIAWRDAVWSACYAHMDKVLAGQAPIPTKEELIAMLPVMVWPA